MFLSDMYILLIRFINKINKKNSTYTSIKNVVILMFLFKILLDNIFITKK